MPNREIAGNSVELDEQGYMTRPDQWNRTIAEALAVEAGIGPLTDLHWKVIEFCREDAKEQGAPPGLRRITQRTGVGTKDLYRLFPKGPGKLAALVSGLGKPRSCV